MKRFLSLLLALVLTLGLIPAQAAPLMTDEATQRVETPQGEEVAPAEALATEATNGQEAITQTWDGNELSEATQIPGPGTENLGQEENVSTGEETSDDEYPTSENVDVPLSANTYLTEEKNVEENALGLEDEPSVDGVGLNELSAKEEPASQENYQATSAAIHSGRCGSDATWTLNTETGVLTISGTGSVKRYNSSIWDWNESQVRSVVISDGITGIEERVFDSHENLKDVYIPESVTSIGEYAFFQAGVKTITLPATASIGEYAFDDTNVEAVTLTGKGPMTTYSSVQACPWYGAWRRGTETSVSIVIEDGVTSVSPGAFNACPGIVSMTIADSVTNIGDYAFRGCSRLTSITIPDSVTEVGNEVLKNCVSLQCISMPATIKYDFDAFDNCTAITKVELTGNGAMSDCFRYLNYDCSPWRSSSKAVSVEIKNGVTSIGNGAFYCCDQLTSVTIPDSVTSIGNKEFYDCDQLTTVSIGGGVTSIGENAFASCANLDNVIIPDSVVSIGNGAFLGCSGLTGNLVIPDSVTTIGKIAFSGCSGFTGNLVVPDSVTTIGESAFSDCSGFTGNLVIPDSVTMIGESAFSGCSGFTGSLVIPDSVTTIGKSAFSGCSGFTGNLVIPDSVTTIGESTFSGCRGFTGSLIIPGNVTRIGDSAFENCSGFIGSLTIGSRVTTIGQDAFYGCSGLTGNLSIPDSVTEIGRNAFYGCNSLTGSLTIGNGITQIDQYMFRGCNSFTGDLTIGNSVTLIGENAFSSCNGFTGELAIPNSVTKIGGSAFSGCSGFTGNLVIPNSVTTIWSSAFSSCTGLTSVSIPNSVTSIEHGVFYGCTGLTSVTIPNSVTSIGDSAFYRCSGLTSVTIPDSVTDMGYYSFSGCSNLNTVLYGGTEDQWNAITGSKPSGENVTVYYGVTSMDDIQAASGTTITFDKKFYTGTAGTEMILWAGLLAGEENCQTLADSLVWASSDENVFPLDADGASALVYGPTTGEVFRTATPKAAGTSTVTVTTSDGASASCVVAVSEGKVAFTVPGETYTVREGNSGVAFVDITAPDTTGLNWTWTSSDSNIVSFEQYKAVGSVDVLQPNIPGRDPYRLSDSIKFYGRSPGTATLTCTSEDGKASASRTVVVVGADSQEQAIASNHYNVPKYETPQVANATEQLDRYYADWYEAYEGYIGALRAALTAAQKKEGKVEPSLEEQAKALMAADQKAKSRYLTFSAGFPEEWKIYAYQELCGILEAAAEKKLDLSSVNLKDEFTAGSSIVNQVANSISLIRKRETYGNVEVSVNCGNNIGLSLGSMTFTSANQKYASSYTVIICSTLRDSKQMVADYLNQLRDLEVKAVNNIYSAIATDILGQPLGELSEAYLARKMKTQAFEDTLNKLHLGKPFKVLVTCHDYSKKYYNLYKTLKNLRPEDENRLKAELTSLIIDDSSVTDKAAKNAVSILKKAQGKLNDAFFEYARTGKVSPPKKGWLDYILSIIMCPVNVSIYRGDTQIGYVGEDDLWYDENEIIIEENGGAKLIYSKPGDPLTFRVEGEDYGLMSCTVEEYSGGAPTGRLNFYDIPLDDQASFSAALPVGALSENQDQLTLTSGTEAITADEYIPVGVNACVSIGATASDGERGMVLGGGEYARGDAVVLRAIPADGSVFLGWFNEKNDLVSVTGVYEFTAREDTALTARFAENQAPLDRISATVSTENPSTVELFDPGAILSDGPLVLAAQYQDGQMVDVAVGTVSENGATVSFPGRSLGAGWTLFFLGDGQDPACQKVELQ